MAASCLITVKKYWKIWKLGTPSASGSQSGLECQPLLWSRLPKAKSTFFSLFLHFSTKNQWNQEKSAENRKKYFNQLLGVQAPDSWLKYTTTGPLFERVGEEEVPLKRLVLKWTPTPSMRHNKPCLKGMIRVATKYYHLNHFESLAIINSSSKT